MKSFVDNNHIHSIRDDLTGVVIFLAFIWLMFVLDALLPFLPFERLGLIPRSFRGLDGILTMPFVHKDLGHIISNTVPLAVTLVLLAGSRANSAMIVFLTIVLSGALLWLFGREARHIGASGLVFGLVAFHIAAGIFEKRMTSILIAVAVGLLYAGTLFRGVLPFQQGVSWDGHLFGAIAGAIVAFAMAQSLKGNRNPTSSSNQRSTRL